MPNDKVLTKTIVLPVLLLVMLLAMPEGRAQTSALAQPMITGAIVETNLVPLSGNTRPEAVVANDRGRVADNLPMEHMLLQLRRPLVREQALTQLLEQLHDPASPNFHRWLTPDQFGSQFGPAASDIEQITGWLQAHGFRVNVTLPSGMVIDFSGSAGQVRAAFHTEIHNVQARGENHITNMSDPQIPAALAPAVVGIVSLHDFTPRPNIVPRSNYTAGGGSFLMTPPDLATIYNINPLFAAGKSGQGQTIYLIEDTNLFTNQDWITFRSTFGLSGFTGGTLTTVHPGNCADPGVTGDSGEAMLDAEWASAAAPSAAIVMATCKNTSTNGLLIAVQNLINGASPPAIMSISYGACEASNGASFNAAFNAIYQQGVAEGTSIFVSSGDQAGAVCDGGATNATHGIGVNSLASTAFNVAVGGTDFSDAFSGTTSTYWNATNTSTFGSAKSYIPEIPWNSSCGSQLIASFLGFSTTYGSTGFCNSTTASNDGLLAVVGGSGGPSACATGTPATSGVVGGTCQGYAKPSWQTGVVGIPNNGVRNLPDVSLFAASGPWGHTYVYCYSDTTFGGRACTGAPSGWSNAGGTSFASPIMAGVQALVNQNAGGKQGLPNIRYYQLAATEYGAGGSSACNSSKGNAVSSSCIFYDVTQGDNDVPCTGTNNCFRPSGTFGVLSTSNSSYAPAYGTTTGWDFATGIGTVNVNNLVNGWNGTVPPVPPKLSDTHDFNGDGKSDILWRNSDGTVGMWLMNGTQFSASSFGVLDLGWTIVGQRDFNGDGKGDILWRNADGTVGMWLMNGTQFTPSSFGAIPTSWTVVGTGDFNGDGKGDILWVNTNGDVAIWFMNGTTILPSSGIIANVPTNWSVAGTGDFNGDGKWDILWRATDGTVGMWLMNGTQFTASSFGVLPPSWSVVGTGDFNGDGKSDILWRNSDGTVGMWLMNGTQFTPSSFGILPTSWTIVGTGDFNGDGKTDILWRNADGTVGMWLMNGTQFTPSSFGVLPTSWTIQGANAD